MNKKAVKPVEKIALPAVVRVKFGDGTLGTASVSGQKLEFPLLNVKVHGSWLKVEVSRAVLANYNGNPISI